MFAIVFFLLAINVPELILLGSHLLPPNYFEEYLTYLVSLSFPFLPLLALPMGSAGIVEDRESGALQYLLSNPISKIDFLLGRMIGLLLSTTTVIVAGYGLAAIISYSTNLGAYGLLGIVLAIAAAINAAMLGLALIISTLSKKKSTALGIGIFIWFLFTVLSDLGLVGTTLSITSGPQYVLPIILLNPIETATILANLQFQTVADIGITGHIVEVVLGANSSLVLSLDLLLWIGVMFSLVFLIFRRQDVM
jgi:Cu-processing system permease protein